MQVSILSCLWEYYAAVYRHNDKSSRGGTLSMTYLGRTVGPFSGFSAVKCKLPCHPFLPLFCSVYILTVSHFFFSQHLICFLELLHCFMVPSNTIQGPAASQLSHQWIHILHTQEVVTACLLLQKDCLREGELEWPYEIALENLLMNSVFSVAFV